MTPEKRDAAGHWLAAPEAAIARFWSKVDRSAGPDGCWLWLGTRTQYGYGRFPNPDGNPKRVLAHRFAYALRYGPIVGGFHVLHRCDNRQCVNPTHLFLGTIPDNNADMAAKGRYKRALSPTDWAEVKRLYDPATWPSRALGRRFGVSKTTILYALKGRTAQYREVGS